MATPVETTPRGVREARMRWLEQLLEEVDQELASGDWTAESPLLCGELWDFRDYIREELDFGGATEPDAEPAAV